MQRVGNHHARAFHCLLVQLDDDAVCDILEKYPTYKRDRKIVEDVRSGALDGASGLQASGQASGSAGQTISFG